MKGKYEIVFVDGSKKKYGGTLENKGSKVCIEDVCIAKNNIKHIRLIGE